MTMRTAASDAPPSPFRPEWRENGGHGGDFYRIAELHGVPETSILDFSASINPLGVPSSVRRVVKEHLPLLDRYPDPSARELREAISAHYGIGRNGIVCGNGSTEIIYLTVRALRPRVMLIPAPTFTEYERASAWYGVSVKRYALNGSGQFEVDPERFISEMRGCDMAFLCNPNNPTGRVVVKSEMLRIVAAAEEQRCRLVVDEAFIDFCPEHSLIAEAGKTPFLILMRSFTKFFALSGLRLGYGLFHPGLTDTISRAKEPWTVNTLAQKAGVAAIQDRGYAARSFSVMRREKAFLEKAFKETGIEYLPAAANYYLLHHVRASSFVDSLRTKGILVRDCSNFVGLNRSYFRVAVRSRRENSRLITEMGQLCRASS
jgi:threonine-phosphate decarboxylase